MSDINEKSNFVFEFQPVTKLFVGYTGVASEYELGYRSPFRFDRLWRDVYESDEWFLEGLREWRGGKEWC